MRCGNEEVPASAAGMDFPMEEDTYTFSGRFGDVGGHWESGFHTGLDFAAPIGSPVLAAKTGTVPSPGVAGADPNLVTLDHGDGLTTLYAHMGYTPLRTGDRVSAGPDHRDGRRGGQRDRAAPPLRGPPRGPPDGPDAVPGRGGAGATAWGGYANGDDPVVRPLRTARAPRAPAACDAAHAFDAMAAAFAKQNGARLCITDSYRSYAAAGQDLRQEARARGGSRDLQPRLGPGSDLCGGIQSSPAPEHAWMAEHAGRFGWRAPAWAQQGGSKPEPWHWEFGRIS